MLDALCLSFLVLVPTSASVPAPSSSPALRSVAAVSDDPDVVVLTNGKELEGRVLLETPEKVVVRVKNRRTEVPRAEVAEVRSIERSMAEFLKRYDSLGREDVDGLLALARFCEANELLGEAHNLLLRVLTLVPEDERAWTKLGGVKGPKGWRVKVRGRYMTLAQMRERVSDWKNALELTTAHFLLRTDIAPERALDLALNLERAYKTYYEVLGPALELQVFDEVPEVHVCADRRDYPNPPKPGQVAWFSRADNTIHVDGTDPDAALAATHELAQLLIHNSFRTTIGEGGAIAPWAERGIAQAFAVALVIEDGVARWEFGKPATALFLQDAVDKEPLGVRRILTAGNAAFEGGGDAERHAVEAYTLTHFLVNADGGKYRRGFAEYLRSSYKGQGAATHLERALGVEIDAIEKEWRAFVTSVAGR
jgi:hypothetical protein